MEPFYLLIAIIVLALIFDFINGFHDAANAIATVVSTKVLTPFQAVIWSAFFNFVAFFIAKYVIGEFGIADTIAKVADLSAVASPMKVMISALIAAIIWNILTWWLGIPSSSSHTLIGGIAGAALAASHFDLSSVNIKVITNILIFIFVAPLIGMVVGYIIIIITMHIAKNAKPYKADKWFRRLQLVSSAWLSIGHGLNDSQKVMGVIAAALIAGNSIPGLPHWMQMKEMADMPDWVPFSCFLAIAVGTLCGGSKIMNTMGNKITRITPLEGFCAQAAAAFTLSVTERAHIPVSTTHVVTGSIMGVGSAKRLSAVRWGVTLELLWAWVLTIPISALLAMLIYFLVNIIF